MFKAIVDCNSFYCSCERVFRPALAHTPVVVLSNNDGCIVSRSDEAKRLGVGMAVPYHESRHLIEQHGIEVFSSNYNLYGDMSRRVMDTLRAIAGETNVEVYSVDEAFINLHLTAPDQLLEAGREIKQTVEQWTGIQVSVGIAPTKTLAKLANRMAKEDKARTGCVLLLDTPEKIARTLQQTPVGHLWGVGHQLSAKLKNLGIQTAWQLRNMQEEWVRKNMGGVVGVRLLKELKGIEAISMQDPLDTKKMIATTRMFGSPVTDIKDIKEAIATYTSRAAEKLRRQYSAASVISIFVVLKKDVDTQDHRDEPDKNTQHASEETTDERSYRYSQGPTVSAYAVLPNATAYTHELIKPAMQLAESIFKPGASYKKAGVMLSGLVPDTSIQANLFAPPEKNSRRLLMNMVDNINFAMRDDALKFASSGTTRNWKMRQELRSPRYSTRWEELREVR
ncbi:MAG TPA: Y-family DNA polymerase [Chitinophagaceae bacterium]|nr:Y-family DNA polymerase [Chitinophagaceae bacterium]